MRRRNVPCSPCSGGSSSGDCCGLKEKLRILWDRTIGSILRINGISPDGDGDFTIEAGSNIAITERGTGNGLRIDTTGGVSYYTSGDSYVNVDNNDLEISVNVGTGGLAKDDDLQTVADAVADILDGTSTVPNATNATNATNAQYLGNTSSNVGDDTKPIKIVNGQALAVTNDLQTKLTSQDITNQVTINTSYITGVRVMRYGDVVSVSFVGTSTPSTTNNTPVASGLPKAIQGTPTELVQWTDGQHIAMILADIDGTLKMWNSYAYTSGAIYCSLTYICQD